jgi:Spy/CpxP family protein refolding chaperone
MSPATTSEPTTLPVAASATRKAVMWIAAVFVLAAALGSVSGYMYGHRAPGPPLSDDAKRAQKVETLTKELQLTPAQQTQVDGIFRDTQSKFQEIRANSKKESDAQIEVARQAARERLRALMTPEQKPKFEEFLRKMDEDRKNRLPAR